MYIVHFTLYKYIVSVNTIQYVQCTLTYYTVFTRNQNYTNNVIIKDAKWEEQGFEVKWCHANE